MVSAVAVGPCVLGDKDDVEKTAALNEGHAVDLAELEGDDTNGGDCLYEITVPSPLIAGFLHRRCRLEGERRQLRERRPHVRLRLDGGEVHWPGSRLSFGPSAYDV